MSKIKVIFIYISIEFSKYVEKVKEITKLMIYKIKEFIKKIFKRKGE